MANQLLLIIIWGREALQECDELLHQLFCNRGCVVDFGVKQVESPLGAPAEEDSGQQRAHRLSGRAGGVCPLLRRHTGRPRGSPGPRLRPGLPRRQPPSPFPPRGVRRRRRRLAPAQPFAGEEEEGHVGQRPSFAPLRPPRTRRPGLRRRLPEQRPGQQGQGSGGARRGWRGQAGGGQRYPLQGQLQGEGQRLLLQPVV